MNLGQTLETESRCRERIHPSFRELLVQCSGKWEKPTFESYYIRRAQTGDASCDLCIEMERRTRKWLLEIPVAPRIVPDARPMF